MDSLEALIKAKIPCEETGIGFAIRCAQSAVRPITAV